MQRFLSLICVLSLFCGCTPQSIDADVVRPGDTIPSFSVLMEDGTAVSARDLAGKPSAIIFFNTGCGDCRRVLPHLQKAYEEYGSAVRFVAISRAQPAREVREYWDANGYDIPFSAQTDNAVYKLFANSRIPRVYVVDKNGVIRYSFDDNPTPDYAQIEEALRNI